MLTDYRLELSTGVALAAGVATPTKSIDLKAASDPGEGEALWYLTVVVGVNESDLLVELIAADNADLTTNVVVWSTVSIAGFLTGHVTIPVWNPFRGIGVGGVPNLLVTASQKRYVGLRMTSVAGGLSFEVIGSLAPPAISPLIYPASTSS